MNLRILVLILLAMSTVVRAEESGEANAEAPRKPSVMHRVLKPWTLFQPAKPAKPGAVKWKQLTMTMKLEPLPLRLSETRQLKATLQLANHGKRLVQLDFPTTQRIEVLVRNAHGKLVEQWSEDQSFSNEPTLVVINPGERLEYAVTVSTRDMAAGQLYSVETFFPNYDQLRASKSIIPEK